MHLLLAGTHFHGLDVGTTSAELAWGRVLHAAGDDVALGKVMHPCLQRMSDWPADSCAGHTVKMSCGFMMQPTNSAHGMLRELQYYGDGSIKLDRRGADEASVTSNLKVPSERCENTRCDDELGP
jgi:hypothetical protein